MRARHPLSLLAALALLWPLAAAAAPACVPGAHCPMAALMADGPPCHGSAIQADDCCPEAAAAETADLAPASGPAAAATTDRPPASCPESGSDRSLAGRFDPPSTPLYRLFRALLI